MKKIIYSAVLLLVLNLILGLSSCKKDEVVVDYKASLQAKNWKLTSLVIGGKETFQELDKCGQDDLRIYNADGTVTEDEGASKCISSDPQQSKIGTWTISADGKTITYNDSFGDTYAQTVLELSATSLKIQYLDLGLTWVETYVKQ